jgi:predicted ester cyclase
MHAKTSVALPDFQETIEDIVAEGDEVTVRFKGTGTHKGEHFGIPPLKKR